MNRIILAALLLVLVASVSAVEITEFDDGPEVSFPVGPDDSPSTTLTFDTGVCVDVARFSIGGTPVSGATSTDPADIVLITDTSGSMRTSGWYLDKYPDTPLDSFVDVSVPRGKYSSDLNVDVPAGVERLTFMLEWDGIPGIDGSEGSEFELEVVGPGFSRGYADEGGRPTASFSGRTTKPQVVYVENPNEGEWTVSVYGHNYRPSTSSHNEHPVNVSVYAGAADEFEKGPTVISIDAAQQAVDNFLVSLQDAIDDGTLTETYRVAYVVFGNVAEVVSGLTDTYDAIDTTMTTTGGTHLELAFDKARSILSAADVVDRKYVIALTDGQNDDPPWEVLEAAEALKNEGAEVYTIGLTDFVNDEMLEDAASTPEQYFYSRDGTELASVYDQIQQNILLSSSNPQPSINITRLGYGEDTLEFNATTPLGSTVVWNDATCGGNDCTPLIETLNRKLIACNNDGTPIECPIEFSVYSPTEGTVNLSDLFIETKLGYTGPITIPDGDGEIVGGGEGFTCDNLYVCGNGQLDPGEVCDTGGAESLVMTLIQDTQSMEVCNYPYGGQDFNDELDVSPCTGDEFISTHTAARIANDEFAQAYLEYPSSEMGAVVIHVNQPPGQVMRPTTDYTEVFDKLSGSIGGTPDSCLACGIDASANKIEEVASGLSEKTIILMSDGYSSGCLGPNGNLDNNCNHFGDPSAPLEERARQNAIEVACELGDRGYTIYTVGFPSPYQNMTVLEEISGCTDDGAHFLPESLQDLIEVYRNLAEGTAIECTDTCEYFNPITPMCGDNIQNFGEQCDFGTANTMDCDPAGRVSCTYCSTSCDLVTNYEYGPETGLCGDGVLQSPNSVGTLEQCDFGIANRLPGDGCPAGDGPCTICTVDTCQLVSLPGPPNEGYCGDGYTSDAEDCDFGTANADWCEPEFVEGVGGSCTVCFATGPDACTLTTNITGPNPGTVCGDGVVDIALNEQCDRGYGQNTDEPCNPAINGECSICTTSCELETYRGPFSPFSYCGDGSVQQPNDRGTDGPLDDGYEMCDWGTANRDSCDPSVDSDLDGTDEEERCIVCTSWCELLLNESQPPDDDNEPYCGDGVVNSSLGEQCDRGSDVNTDTACSPNSGGTCSICTTSCQLEVYDNPYNDACVDIIVGPNPGPYNLNSYVGSQLTFDLDLDWDDENWYDSTLDADGNSLLDPEIVSNNVLTINPDSAFTVGRLVLDVRDDDDNTASLCLDFTAQSAAYGMTPEPDTRLLIREGRLVSGYYEEPLTGTIDTWGPYRISLEVWQR